MFVTAHDDYAVEAFDRNAADYLLKPLTDARLLRCIARLQREEQASGAASASAPMLMPMPRDTAPVRWLTVSAGDTTRLVSIEDVLYFQAADKYTEVVTATARHVIRTPLKELLPRLDAESFAQVHRSVIVAYAAVDRVERDLMGRLKIHLRDEAAVLPVSRAYAGQFRQM